MSQFARFLLLALLSAGALAAAPEPWAQLKLGLSPQQTATLLGEPLSRRHGKGFETWTYDHGAEVLFYGGNAVVGWTAPASAGLPRRSHDAWSNQPAGQYYATLYSLLQSPGVIPRAASAIPPKKILAAPAPAGDGDEYHFRARKG